MRDFRKRIYLHGSSGNGEGKRGWGRGRGEGMGWGGGGLRAIHKAFDMELKTLRSGQNFMHSNVRQKKIKKRKNNNSLIKNTHYDFIYACLSDHELMK